MRTAALVTLVALVACVRRPNIAERAAAMREQLGDYRVIEIIAEGGEGTTTWAAHYDDGGSVRYIRERSRQEDAAAADREFWFENRRLVAYASRATASPGAEEVVVYLGFDGAGGLAEQSKTVGGSPEGVQATEVAAAKARAAFLERAAERTLTRPTSVTAPTFTTNPAVPGRLTLENGKLRFIACGEENGRGVLIDDFPDERGATLLRALGGTAAVLVRLDEDRLREIRYAAPEGTTCDRRRREGDVLAAGTEPFWSVRVDGADALLRTPSDAEGVVFRDGMWTRTGDGPWVFRARRGSPAGVEHLMMELTDERCAAGMSGTRFPMKAVVSREAERMVGCAVEGAGRGKAEAR